MNEMDLSLVYLRLYWEVALCIGIVMMLISALKDSIDE